MVAVGVGVAVAVAVAVGVGVVVGVVVVVGVAVGVVVVVGVGVGVVVVVGVAVVREAEMMSREHELILDLRSARGNVRAALVAEHEARAGLATAKAARLKAEGVVEEILAEMDGTADRPLLEAINGLDDLRRYDVEHESPGEPDPDAPTLHWTIYRPAQLGSPGEKHRLGTQIARTEAEALQLARKAWPGVLIIGESFEHGPDCGCGSEPPTYRKRKAKAKAGAS